MFKVPKSAKQAFDTWSVQHAVHHHWLCQHQSEVHGWVQRYRDRYGRIPAQPLHGQQFKHLSQRPGDYPVHVNTACDAALRVMQQCMDATLYGL